MTKKDIRWDFDEFALRKLKLEDNRLHTDSDSKSPETSNWSSGYGGHRGRIARYAIKIKEEYMNRFNEAIDINLLYRAIELFGPDDVAELLFNKNPPSPTDIGQLDLKRIIEEFDSQPIDVEGLGLRVVIFPNEVKIDPAKISKQIGYNDLINGLMPKTVSVRYLGSITVIFDYNKP